MKTFYFLTLSVLSIEISGQNNFLGVKAGVNNTNNFRELNYPSSSTKAGTGFIGGFTFEVLLNRTFSATTELLYEQTGFTVDILKENLNGDLTIEDTDINADIIGIPFTLGASFGETFYGNLHLGLVPSLFLNANYENATESQNLKDGMNALDLGFLIGGGIGYRLTDKAKLYSMVRYKETFGNHINNYTPFGLTDYRYKGFSVTIGYSYALTSSNFSPSIVSEERDSYLVKSKQQKRTGTILIGTGLMAGLLGAIYQSSMEDKGGFNFTGAFIGIGGAAVLATGVIFHIVATGNKAKSGRPVGESNL